MAYKNPILVRREQMVADFHKRDLPSYEWQGAPPVAAYDWQGPPMPVPIDGAYTSRVVPPRAWWEVRQPAVGWRWVRAEPERKVHKLRLRIERDVVVSIGTGGASASARCVEKLVGPVRVGGELGREAVARARLGYAAFGGFINGEFTDGKGRQLGFEPPTCKDRVLQSGLTLATDVEEFRFLSRMVRRAG